jgi:hypothetical protein
MQQRLINGSDCGLRLSRQRPRQITGIVFGALDGGPIIGYQIDH